MMGQSRTRRVLIKLTVLGVGIYVFYAALLFVVQGYLIFPHHMAGSGLPTLPIGVKSVWLEADEAKTEVWVVPAKNESKGYVVFTHGNAELIDDCVGDAQRWSEFGYHVILPEFRGYGRSGGSPSQDAIVRDVVSAVKVVANNNEQLIFHGRSLGTGIAVQAAKQFTGRTRAMVLESPFRSVASFAWGFGLPPFLVRSPFRTDEVIATFTFPIIIITGSEDTIVPPEHGKALAGLAKQATLVTLKGGHNSGLSQQREYWDAIERIVDK